MPEPASLERWWRAWAPYWGDIEDRHLGVFLTGQLLGDIRSPVLVIGAGQGLVVEHLRRKGHAVDGVDLEPEMIALARSRRSLRLIRADARALPFDRRVYRTVIIATGVVDYLSEPDDIGAILKEALRVLRPSGNLLVCFYRLSPRVEAIYRRLGVIAPDGNYYLKRMFDLFTTVKRRPLQCPAMISGWTGSGYLPALLFWTRVGLTLPAELRRDDRKIAGVFGRARAAGLSPDALYDAIPDGIPYRDDAAVQALAERLGLRPIGLERALDCTVLKHYKSGFVDHGRTASAPPAGGNGAPASGWIIAAEKLVKRYPGSKAAAVDGIDLQIAAGTIFGLLGPNGAGKTTTLSILSGLTRPDSGSIAFSGALGAGGRKARLGYVPQDLAVYPKLTGRDNLRFFGRLYGVKGERLDRRIGELLAMVGLEERADELVSRYSTGMTRRLNLAAGLIHEPAVLLLDEPTVGIDPQSRNCIFEAVQKLKAGGVTILYTTHYMEEAEALCDRIAIIDRGRIVLEGPPRELVERYGIFRIRIAAEPLPADLVRSLAKIDGVFDCLENGGGLTLLSRSRRGSMGVVESVRAVAERCGAEVTLASVEPPNLESLFLDITGRSLRDRINGYPGARG